MSSTTPPTGVQLPRFERLPTEIRLLIWRTARRQQPQRIVEISFERTIGHIISLIPAPALLGVCRESRGELYQSYSRLPTAPRAPIIFVDLERDMVFVREDRQGILASQNLLLRNIFGTSLVTTVWDMSGVKNLALDYWVVERVVNDFEPLRQLRNLQTFTIILASNASQINQNTTPTQHFSYDGNSVNDLTNVGFRRADIQMAVQDFWRVGNNPGALAFAVWNTVAFQIDAEVNFQLTIDNNWRVPAHDVVAYGPF
ncbi:hypothetical protein G7Y89_g185 [Cudoniella acicularis]|uniref:2EXR domain-containing protein n=1 Tax=Cudoniella acicularis TaxID=354080 RepID=A0A8H4RXM3_9HELO|nr:hypothetical protein G7Y89_g185 [Cudoniella acicularis]